MMQGRQPTDENYDAVMTQLEAEYNNKAKIIDALQTKLRKVIPAQDTANSLRTTYIEIEAYLRSLELQGVKVEENEETRKTVMRKFPERVINAISNNETLTLKNIRTNLEVVISNKEIFENSQEASFLGPSATEKQTEKNTQVESLAFASQFRQKPGIQTKRIEEKKCAFCSKPHFSSQCRTFDTAAKPRDALQGWTCYACLSPNHSVRTCNNRSPCYFCSNDSHHSSLCPQRFGRFEPKWRVTEKIKEKQIEKQTDTTDTGKQTVKRAVNLAMKGRGNLITIRAQIRNPNTNEIMQSRIFLDNGCDSTYILNHYAKTLNLQPLAQRELEVQVFLRETSERVDTNAVQFEILSEKNPHFKLDVIADTIPATPFIETYDVDKFKREHPKYANFHPI